MLFAKLPFRFWGNCLNFKIIIKTIRYSRDLKQKTPYDILGVSPTSSTKEIKAAYVKLCKHLHPDMKPGDAAQHEKFIELNNAYNTLINPNGRKLPRNNMQQDAKKHRQQYNEYEFYKSAKQEKAWYEEDEYKNQFKRHSKTVKKRVPDSWIFMGCFLLMFVGSLLYLCAYSFSRYYLYRKAEEKSKRISESYSKAKRKTIQ